MAAGGKGFVLFARSQPDTPGKLTAHAISYENLELAGYELLARVAERAGDQETAEVAREIRDQEHAMSERLQGALPRAVDASLRDQSPDDLRDHGSPTPLKDAGMRVGALNWGAFFAAQPDTPGKLAAVAERAGDQATVAAAEEILVQERAAAAKIAGQWDRAVEASLRAVGAAA